ncbi:MAG: hypothetical protein KA327_10345 [Pseudarcicella sp.]|nr:hypothetical protein [Pseudarcicella sp.]
MKIRFTKICFFLVIPSLAFSQLYNTSLENQSPVLASEKNQLSMDFQSFSFIRNNEYFNKIADGYTLFGNSISPTIRYQPSEHFAINTGIFLNKDFGNDKLTAVQPIFSIKVQRDSAQFVFGNIATNQHHRLIEPMLNIERLISHQQAYGMQYRIQNGHKTFFDFWVDWQKMVYKGDNAKETFLAGINLNKKVFEKNNFLLKIPFQATFKHRGGQIVIDTARLSTEMNFATGFEAFFKTKNSFFKEFIFQNYYLVFSDKSKTKPELSKGNAVYLNLTSKTAFGNLMLSYWQGNNYFSPNGGDLFNSQSTNFKNKDHFESSRNLIILKFIKDIKLADYLDLHFRFEPYYDLNNRLFEHSESIFLTYKQRFVLKKIKKNLNTF